MSDEELIDALLQISQMIANEDDKQKILYTIASVASKINKKQDRAANYIDNLIKDLK